MLRFVKMLSVSLAVLLVAQAFVTPTPPVVVAQDAEELVHNPELYLPRNRTDEGVTRKLREARNREFEALKLASAGKEKLAQDKWQNAFGLYLRVYKDFVRPDIAADEELLVPTRFPRVSKAKHRRNGIETYTLPYVPVADYLNWRLRQEAWPASFRTRLERHQTGPGKDMFERAIDDENYALLARCARFYQFSESGRLALIMLSKGALERGDSVLAIKWLNEFRRSWPEEYLVDLQTQLLYLRACRDANLRFELELELARMETRGKDGDIDVGGSKVKFLEFARTLAYSPAPHSRPELTATGWRTLQGDSSRNKLAPPVQSITGLVDLTPNDDNDANPWAELSKNVPGMGDTSNDPWAGRRSSSSDSRVPLVFPTVHETGIFVHRIGSNGQNERLNWYRHGKETTPLPLEVPSKYRYPKVGTNNNNRWFGGGNSSRKRYRVLGSTIGRVKWDLDNRESDILFAVLGEGSPQRETKTDATGNQIQAFDLSPDASLRVTMPNKKVESKDDYDFLKHVIFNGAPIVRDNRMYIAGCRAGQDTFEVWVFCFDVTPKGDPAEGEGKMVWKTKICAKKYSSGGSWWAPPIKLPDVSSLAEQGGMLYFSSHAGCNAGIDRHSGEMVWVSKYNRLASNNPTMIPSWINPTPLADSGFSIAAPYDENLAFVMHGTFGGLSLEYPTRRRGKTDENKHLLGLYDNCMLIQGKNFLYSATITTYNPDSPEKADWASMRFRSGKFEDEPIGRGVVAGDMILIPFSDMISMYDLSNGKLVRNYKFPDGVNTSAAPVTLTVYCRGESYEDEDGLKRFKPLTVTDPDTGNVYNVENMHNGEEFIFPSGTKVIVKKETFVLMTSADRMFMFTASDK
ncbi:MAG: hypothetical protein L3J82_04380 [Planctomycetes bacterium]|nr:hypothetical protein [Planctomycetota bacterium]